MFLIICANVQYLTCVRLLLLNMNRDYYYTKYYLLLKFSLHQKNLFIKTKHHFH